MTRPDPRRRRMSAPLKVLALLLERQSQKGRRVQKAIALMEQGTVPSTGREAIPTTQP